MDMESKYDCNGSLRRYKARLVVYTYEQINGVDFSETFITVVCLN